MYSLLYLSCIFEILKSSKSECGVYNKYDSFK